MTDGTTLQTSPDVVFSELVDGGILFDLNAKQYYALNSSGVYLWKAFEAGASPEQIVAGLGGRNGTSHAEKDLTEFARLLLSHRLAERVPVRTSATVSLDAAPASWTAPTLTPHGNPLAQVIRAPFDPTVPIPE
jgi:hypothetical protein